VLEELKAKAWVVALLMLGAVVLAVLPLYVTSYTVSVFIILYANVALATAWAFFSGATRYISLATAAFFGTGIYVLAVAHVYVPVAAALALAALAGFLVALVVGFSTLRLRGVYFVVFTFGLTELVHQVFNWWDIRINKTATRYIFTDVSNATIYWTLLAAALIAMIGSWYVSRIRLGYALRAIGEDETVARHTGIDTTRVKIVCFALSASMMAFVGAVLALRYPYIDASIAFNSNWSFQVLIAALLGGPTRPWGPAVGAVPLVFLSEFLAGTFPHHFSIALGLCFVVIVYFLPGGVAPLLERWWHALRAPRDPGARQLSLSARLAARLRAGADRLEAGGRT
jgi:branched-chain amino acid transport system permease protein